MEQLEAEQQALQERLSVSTQERDQQQKEKEAEAQTVQELREALDKQDEEMEALIVKWQAGGESSRSGGSRAERGEGASSDGSTSKAHDREQAAANEASDSEQESGRGAAELRARERGGAAGQVEVQDMSRPRDERDSASVRPSAAVFDMRLGYRTGGADW